MCVFSKWDFFVVVWIVLQAFFLLKEENIVSETSTVWIQYMIWWFNIVKIFVKWLYKLFVTHEVVFTQNLEQMKGDKTMEKSSSKAEFDSLEFEKRLTNLKDTQESIQALSAWCLQNRMHHKKIVASWLIVLKQGKKTHKIRSNSMGSIGMINIIFNEFGGTIPSIIMGK